METPRTNYILIDHENVHALDPGEIAEIPVKVLVFLGKQTTKLPVEDVQRLLLHGSKIELITISGNGKNALDFHIAYYAGLICAQDPGAAIHIVSKDTGFDPLIEHLKSKKVQAQRSAEVPKFGPQPKKKAAPKVAQAPAAAKEPIDRLIAILTKNAKARPRKRKTLASSIASHFKQLTAVEVDDLIALLEGRGKIAIDEKGSVTYLL